MVKRVGPADSEVVLKFGGGEHTRASEDDINPRESSVGQNYALDLQNKNLRPRKPFDLVGTVPSAADMTINGFATLLKADGTVKMLVQAGTTVYDWDGTSGFTSKGTVVSGAKIRGRLESNFQLDDKVIITDVALKEPVLEYDGTTLSNTSFTKNDGSTAWTGDFIARYCIVDDERAIFSNIKDNTSTLPHLIVGSKRSNFSIISNDQRPSSALSDEDPFFLLQPDLKYINGMTGAFGVIITSSAQGDLFKLTGSTAKDFAMDSLHARSGADGDEAVAFTGNDVLYGRQGRIESVVSTDEFGDVDTNDLSIDISDQIVDYKNWTLVYNSRKQRVYCFANGQSNLFVYHKDLIKEEDEDMSPWGRWVTAHGIDFQPTAVMNCLDPSDGLEYVFMGDSSGNLYRLEGTGTAGDGGTTNIRTVFTTKTIQIPLDAEAFDIDGWIRYKKLDNVSVRISFRYEGYNVFDRQIVVNIPSTSVASTIYNGSKYYSSGQYYGSTFRERLTRQRFATTGRGTAFKVEVVVDGTGDFEIAEIGLRFKAAT